MPSSRRSRSRFSRYRRRFCSRSSACTPLAARSTAQDLDRPETPWEKFDRFQRSVTTQEGVALSYFELCRAVDGDDASLYQYSVALSPADSIPFSAGSARERWIYGKDQSHRSLASLLTDQGHEQQGVQGNEETVEWQYHMLNSVDGSGRNALHRAALSGTPEECRAILACADFVIVNDKSSRNWTALHYAAERGCAEICEAILAHPDFTEVAHERRGGAQPFLDGTALDIAKIRKQWAPGGKRRRTQEQRPWDHCIAAIRSAMGRRE